MKRLSLLLAPLCIASLLADCKTIVERTVAELRAAYPDWDDRMETLARTAAGSACVKAAQPGNSGAAPENATPAAAAREDKAVMTTTAVAAAGANNEAASDDEEGDSDDAAGKDDDGWNPLQDIKFNKVNTRPGKKPYERRREVNETD